MDTTKWDALGIDLPYGASGEVRVTCPKCTPGRKPQNQRRKDLAVNTDDNPHVCGGTGILEGTKYRNAPAMLSTSRGASQEEQSPMHDHSIPCTTKSTTESLPSTRGEALAVGSRHYFTGKPCPEGHVARRFASNYGCEECLKLHSRTYYEKNVDSQRRRHREYAKRDPEGNRRRSAQWASANPEKNEVMQINTMARLRGAVGTVALDEWTSLKSQFGDRCACCGDSETPVGADHVVPICNGGTNTIDNIQPLCFPCNQAKWRRSTDYRKQVDR